MDILHSDRVIRLAADESPNYKDSNPLDAVARLVEETRFAVDREWYSRDDLQYLFPLRDLELYGPQGEDRDQLDPALQDNKTDFQKQNLKHFSVAPTQLVRGWVSTGTWTGAFLKLSYQSGPDTPLWETVKGSPGQSLRLWIKVNERVCAQPLVVPWNPENQRYEVEIWGYEGPDLHEVLRDQSALKSGALVVDPYLVNGSQADFALADLSGRDLREVAVSSTMHPILPLRIECAWGDETSTHWDSRSGQNYRFEFNMKLRGWTSFLSGGVSDNPHGGVGTLDYRTLFSNYGRFAESHELRRQIETWSFDAFGKKAPEVRSENFMAVDYMDLHVIRDNCGIGLHRHRDNQEVFMMLDGRALMVIGDWCEHEERERCLEVRTLRSGHMALLKGGHFHGLLNLTDEQNLLFMFGGYD